MTDGYERARAQRNALERLMDKIPGFGGFQDRELRRDVDKLQREHLASELLRLKAVVRDRSRDYVDAGKIGLLNLFDRLDRQLDGLSQSVRFAEYGASGLFDPVKIGEPELQRLYEFDLSLLDDLSALNSELGGLPRPGAEDPTPVLERSLARLRGLEDKWRSRQQVITDVVRTGRSA